MISEGTPERYGALLKDLLLIYCLGHRNLLPLKPLSDTTVSPSHLGVPPQSSLASLLSTHHDNDDLRLGYTLRRFWFRTFVGLIVPPVVTGYYIVLATYYLVPQDDATNPFKIGPPGANYIFVTWFVVGMPPHEPGVFGLDAARYGLVGAEAGMLMYNRWLAPRNAMQLMMHADRTWTGPGGWFKVIQKVRFLRRGSSSGQQLQDRIPSGIWFILLVLSALPMIALPLSGLCLEVGDGYVWQTSGPSRVEVLGQNQSVFDAREPYPLSREARARWVTSAPVRIPGLGVMYTKPDLSRSNYDYLNNYPNTFPADDGIPEMFLTSQTAVPVSGVTWGLVIKYNCTSVDELEDFTILNQFYESGNHTVPEDLGDDMGRPISQRQLNDNSDIIIKDHRPPLISNFESIAEIGMSWAPLESLSPFYSSNMGRNTTTLREESIIEYLLYQSLMGPEFEGVTYEVDMTGNNAAAQMDMGVDIPIPNIAGIHRTLHHPGPSKNVTSDYEGEPMKVAVGVRCTSSSEAGLAFVDGRTSTFTGFTRHDALSAGVSIGRPVGTPVFSAGAASLVRSGGIEDIRESVDGRGSIIALTDMGMKNLTAGYFQSKQLRTSLLQAHATYALQLLYDGTPKYDDISQYLKFSNSSSNDPTRSPYRPYSFYTHENFTAATPGSVLRRGPIKYVWVPLFFLVPWTVGTMLLVLMYSHRPRWSEKFDGYSLFRFGADFADDLKGCRDFLSTEDYEKCDALLKLPGRVGDSRPLFKPGHISLVRGDGVAARNKVYA
ncbi:hypothetical protein FQN50_005588 [Emmonsiellopsis sp. PD_5]|nr:hypothetical protein FQN50_005588 [Emmonsiellopsis sp. PD_5]